LLGLCREKFYDGPKVPRVNEFRLTGYFRSNAQLGGHDALRTMTQIG